MLVDLIFKEGRTVFLAGNVFRAERKHVYPARNVYRAEGKPLFQAGNVFHAEGRLLFPEGNVFSTERNLLFTGRKAVCREGKVKGCDMNEEIKCKGGQLCVLWKRLKRVVHGCI